MHCVSYILRNIWKLWKCFYWTITRPEKTELGSGSSITVFYFDSRPDSLVFLSDFHLPCFSPINLDSANWYESKNNISAPSADLGCSPSGETALSYFIRGRQTREALTGWTVCHLMHLNAFVLQPASGAEKEKWALLYGLVIIIDRAAAAIRGVASLCWNKQTRPVVEFRHGSDALRYSMCFAH